MNVNVFVLLAAIGSLNNPVVLYVLICTYVSCLLYTLCI